MTENKKGEEMLTTTQAAKELNLSSSMVHKLIRTGKLKAEKESGAGRQRAKITIARSEVQAYMDSLKH